MNPSLLYLLSMYSNIHIRFAFLLLAFNQSAVFPAKQHDIQVPQSVASSQSGSTGR